jgi:putative ABC transport system permease protein
MIFFKLILNNLLRHRIRSLISVAGIAFSVAAMLTIVTVLQGAVGMFSGILSSDSEVIVFERNVSDLFFSNVPAMAVQEIASWSTVQHADPVLFGIVSSADHPIITCFGITNADARLRNQRARGTRASAPTHRSNGTEPSSGPSNPEAFWWRKTANRTLPGPDEQPSHPARR